MFGKIDVPKPNPRTRPHPVLVDYKLPTPTPYHWGHMGRAPNTDYHYKLLQYKQRKDADYAVAVEQQNAQKAKDLFCMKFDKHTEKRRFHGEIEKRLKVRMQEYEEAIDRRREKLREIFAKEEREFYRETVDNAQKGADTHMESMKRKADALKSQREAERLTIVKEKRLQQYMQRCVDLRGALAKKNAIESRNGLLQQMRENEARREAEREIDHVWHEVAINEMEAKRNREEYDAIDRYQRDKHVKEVWEMQMQGKELLRKEMEKIAQEDKIELEKLSERMKKEEIELLIAKRRKRDQFDKQLREQVLCQGKLTAQRKKEEDALDQAFILLAQMEIDKEKAKRVDTTSEAKREMAQYRQSLVELEEQRREEDRLLNQLLEEYKKEIDRKQDQQRCKIRAAKLKLQEDVIREREEQIKYKQLIAEEELKMKKDDNELVRYAHEVNGRLAVEMARQEKLARLQYKDDLLKQIEYQKILQQREKEEIERQLAAGREEEERYQKLIEDMCSGKIEAHMKHPFRRAIEQYDCHCPETTAKPQ